jgi:hypothetical protein
MGYTFCILCNSAHIIKPSLNLYNMTFIDLIEVVCKTVLEKYSSHEQITILAWDNICAPNAYKNNLEHFNFTVLSDRMADKLRGLICKFRVTPSNNSEFLSEELIDRCASTQCNNIVQHALICLLCLIVYKCPLSG